MDCYIGLCINKFDELIFTLDKEHWVYFSDPLASKMAYYYLCLFLFLSLLFSATQQPPQAAPPPHSYVFAVQWPNSYCNAPSCASRPCAHPIPQRFTIHGLWPDNAAGKPMPPWPGAAVLNSAAVCADDLYNFLLFLFTSLRSVFYLKLSKSINVY